MQLLQFIKKTKKGTIWSRNETTSGATPMALFDIPTWVGQYFMVSLTLFINTITVIAILFGLFLLRLLYEVIRRSL